MVATDFNKKAVQELYDQLMSMSRKLQYQQTGQSRGPGQASIYRGVLLDDKNARIVFPGTEGAYSQAATKNYFGEDCNNFYVRTFRDAMEAIEEGAADFAVLPIENSTAGSVDEMYDLLVEFENYIVGETIIPIVNTLAGLPGTELADIQRVYSKGVALMQASVSWTSTATGSRSAWPIRRLRQRRCWMSRIRPRRPCAAPMRPRCMAWRCWRIISMMIVGIPPDSSWSPTRRSS